VIGDWLKKGKGKVKRDEGRGKGIGVFSVHNFLVD
jgi:hypothetical protein